METTTNRRGWRLLAAVVLGLLLLSACSSDDSDSSSDMSSLDAESADVAVAATEASGPREDAASDDSAGEVGVSAAAPAPGEDTAADADDAADGAESAQVPVDTTGTAATGERIIKEGTVTVEVEPGEFDEAFAEVIVRAQELGGHVAGSSSSTDPAPLREDGEGPEVLVSGQVTIRVPVRNFEDLLTAVGGAGEIVDRNVTSQDVTAEFTDLESRRRHLQAQERFYLGLLEQAASVPDAIAVQQQLDGIQSQIEQITGRLTLLEDRTSFSTLTIRLREQGAEPVEPEVQEEPTGLAPYLTDARDVFVSTVGSILVAATFIVPFAVLALLALGVWRLVRPGRSATARDHVERRPAPAAPQVGEREPVTVGGGSENPPPER